MAETKTTKKKFRLRKTNVPKIHREDKLYISYSKNDQKPERKEIVLFDSSYVGQPEKVSITLGTTISPREFESIRVDYHCEIHHQPGQKFRDEAFELARANCLERLEEDLVDMHSCGMIKDHHLLPEDEFQLKL